GLRDPYRFRELEQIQCNRERFSRCRQSIHRKMARPKAAGLILRQNRLPEMLFQMIVWRPPRASDRDEKSPRSRKCQSRRALAPELKEKSRRRRQTGEAPDSVGWRISQVTGT